jgi:hypothetical protein
MEGWLRFLLRPTVALLLSPLGLLLISATRLLIVSDDRPVTATAIASSGGYVNTLLGTLIPLVPIFIPYVALILLFFRRFLLSALAFMAAAFISPARIHGRQTSYTLTYDWHAFLAWIDANGTIVLVLFLILVNIFYGWYVRSWRWYRWFSLFWIIAATAILLPIVAPVYPIPSAINFYTTMLRQPWLPSEKITLTSGQVDYGYVLSDSNGWFELLTAGSRTIRYIPAREVASRGVCQQQEEKFSPFIPLPPTTPPQMPRCLNLDGPAPQ